MSSGYEVRYDPAVLAVLEETVAYIEDQSGASRAVAWLDAMNASIQQLETSPRAFPAVCFRRGRPIHSKLVMNHRVYYFIDDPTRLVYVVDVIHTARETQLAMYREPQD